MKLAGSITQNTVGKHPVATLGCFFSLFLLVGAGVFFFIFVRPVQQILAADSWDEVPCVVLSSRVASHSGSKGSTTYSVEVEYEYWVDDKRYTSDRYSFAVGSTSGYEGKREVVDGLPPGKQTVCYVNPSDPADVVLERGMTAQVWVGLFPLIFVAVGGGGLLFVVGAARSKRSHAPTRREKGPAVRPAAMPAAPGPVTIRPAVSPVKKLLMALAVALFWNGIVSVFVYQAVAGSRTDWSLGIFLIPFVLVGAGMIGWIVYQFLALFNLRPIVRLGAASIALGDSFDVEWETAGNLGRIRTFRIVLEGREEATYSQGKNTRTDREAFETRIISEGAGGEFLRRGRTRVELPVDTMHSWKSSNNRIAWMIRVQAECPNWPDLDEEFSIEMLPRASVARRVRA